MHCVQRSYSDCVLVYYSSLCGTVYLKYHTVPQSELQHYVWEIVDLPQQNLTDAGLAQLHLTPHNVHLAEYATSATSLE
jgi:hypothetical protein